MPLLFSADYHCRLLPQMQELLATPEEAARALLLLYEKTGLAQYWMMPRYDCAESPVAFCLRREKALRLLREQLPASIRLQASCAALLSKGLFETAHLECLFLSRSKRLLPVEMPLLPYADWMDEELNGLLHVRHCKLFFLSFERCVALYPTEILQKLSRIAGAYFQFSFASLQDERQCAVMLSLLRQGAAVCFGSGMNALEKVQSMEFDNQLQSFSQPFQRAVLRLLPPRGKISI